MNKERMKICFVSSSGGHYLQLQRLSPLLQKYDGFFVSEKTEFDNSANYVMIQTDVKDPLMVFKMFINSIRTLKVWMKEKPDAVVTTGTLVALPFAILSKIFKKKFIYIESYSRVYSGTKAGRFLYRIADLFIVQWKPLLKIYPNAKFGRKLL